MVSQAVGGDQAGLVLGEAPDRQTRLTPTSQAIHGLCARLDHDPGAGSCLESIPHALHADATDLDSLKVRYRTGG